MNKRLTLGTMATGLLVTGLSLSAADQDHGHQHGAQGAPVQDARQVVHFPPELRVHTLANMRDHLLALSEIQEALSKGWFDKAGTIAEQRLGMASLKFHGAHELSEYMPEAMQAIGSEMHRSASRFALEAENASVTGDVKPALAALSKVTQQCVACHSAYRVQ
jgi:hypothetical protein